MTQREPSEEPSCGRRNGPTLGAAGLSPSSPSLSTAATSAVNGGHLSPPANGVQEPIGDCRTLRENRVNDVLRHVADRDRVRWRVGARTGSEYIDRLAARTPTIEIGGERVTSNIPEHPAFRNVVNTLRAAVRPAARPSPTS